MTIKSIKFSKGTALSIEGKNYQLAKMMTLKLSEGEAIGGHQSDYQIQDYKQTICNILQDRIKDLEEEEKKTLFDIAEDDPLFLFDRGEEVKKAQISMHISHASTIKELKELLEEIKAL